MKSTITPQPVSPIIPPSSKPKKNYGLYLLVSSLAMGIVFISLGVWYFFHSYNQIIVKPNPTPQASKPSITPTPDPDRTFSILMLGYGGGNHDGGRLTDSMIVANINPKTLQIKLISIPRDLWVNLPIYSDKEYYSKINAAYVIGSDDRNYANKLAQFTASAGGGELAKRVVADVVGFPIDYFISVDFQGFSKAIDLLGGVEVKVDRTFDDYQYPIEGKETDLCDFPAETIAAMEATMSGLKLEQAFTCRYEHLHFDKGITHMDGSTALKYVRSRHSATEGGDYNRSNRQRNLLIAVRDKVLSLNFIPKIIPSLKLMTSHVQTDIDIATLESMLGRASSSSQYTITNIAITEENVLKQGRSDDGQFILMPRDGIGIYDNIKKFVEDPSMLTPTPTAKPTAKI